MAQSKNFIQALSIIIWILFHNSVALLGINCLLQLRNLSVISLLVLFVISQVGYYCVYHYQQNRIKEDVKRQLFANVPESSLLVFEIDTPGIEWEEEGKEFYLHGELFDVAKIKNVAGKTFIYCINDKKEEKLLQDLAQTIKSQTDNNGSGKSGKHEIKFQITDLTIKHLENISVFDPALSYRYFSFDAELLTSFKKIKVPPPRA